MEKEKLVFKKIGITIFPVRIVLTMKTKKM
ncbi:unnamed protein product [Ectocarpus sp. 8 AP-2014]